MDNADKFITMDFRGYNWNMTELKMFNNESVEVTVSANSFRRAGISKSGIVSITVRTFKNNLPRINL